jgi:alkylation response protein AidB-like acyl-CoA dehydrogenase
MNFELTDAQSMMCESASRLVSEHCSLDRRRARITRGLGSDPELWALFAELGWLALCVPEEEGGLGGSMVDVALLMIELGRGISTEPIVSSAVMCGRLLADARWEGRSEWVKSMITGGTRLAFAHLEDGNRIEQASRRRTTIERRRDQFSISGSKLLVWDGDGAGAFLVTASSSSGEELVLALLPKEAPGLSISGYPLIDGSRAADVILDDVAVDGANIVARGEAARALIEDAVNRATIANAAAAIGSMEACLEICAEYLKGRSQFGHPIGKFQVLQHMMADMLVSAHNARSALYHALSRVEQSLESRLAAISAARITIGQAALLVSRTGVQLHGAYGVTEEFAISHHYRFLHTLERRLGDSQSHLRRLADLLLAPASGDLDAIGCGQQIRGHGI